MDALDLTSLMGPARGDNDGGHVDPDGCARHDQPSLDWPMRVRLPQRSGWWPSAMDRRDSSVGADLSTADGAHSLRIQPISESTPITISAAQGPIRQPRGRVRLGDGPDARRRHPRAPAAHRTWRRPESTRGVLRPQPPSEAAARSSGSGRASWRMTSATATTTSTAPASTKTVTASDRIAQPRTRAITGFT